MNILFITHQFPYPPNVGSRIRVFNLLKIYAKKHQVTLVSFLRKESDLRHIDSVKEYCEKIYTIPIATCMGFSPTKHKVYLRLHKLFGILPFSVIKFRSKVMEESLKNMNLRNFDVVHIERIYVTVNAKAILSRKSNLNYRLILDFDDYESKKYFRGLGLVKPPKEKILSFLEFLRLTLYEKAVLEKFDQCLVCSDIDKKSLEKRGLKVNFEVIPNGADVAISHTERTEEQDYQILYLGAMNYEPNIDAVLFFCKEIFPFIKKALPKAKFMVVGKTGNPVITNLHNGVDIIIQGFVDDVKEVIGQSALFVVPLRVGGGTRIKILEALSMGKAVVSTSVGCEGIEVTNGKNIEISDNAEEFANKCIELLNDKQKRIALGNQGKILVSTNYSWEKIGEELLNKL